MQTSCDAGDPVVGRVSAPAQVEGEESAELCAGVRRRQGETGDIAQGAVRSVAAGTPCVPRSASSSAPSAAGEAHGDSVSTLSAGRSPCALQSPRNARGVLRGASG